MSEDIIGPSGATPDLIAKCRAEGREFQLYDDDGELYYSGLMWSDKGVGTEDDFAPLDDYGQPSAGCTEIRYRDSYGRFVGL